MLFSRITGSFSAVLLACVFAVILAGCDGRKRNGYWLNSSVLRANDGETRLVLIVRDSRAPLFAVISKTGDGALSVYTSRENGEVKEKLRWRIRVPGSPDITPGSAPPSIYVWDGREVQVIPITDEVQADSEIEALAKDMEFDAAGGQEGATGMLPKS